MSLFLLPLSTIWLFSSKLFWFSTALSIALVFDIQPIVVGPLKFNFHHYFFLLCLFYGLKNGFSISYKVNKDVLYTFVLSSIPLLIIGATGGGLGFIIYLTYFMILGVLCYFIINHRFLTVPFLANFAVVSTAIILIYTVLEMYSFRTNFYVYSSIYDLDGMRPFGGHYGRSLGPSREPSHLILIQIVILWAAIHFRGNLSLFGIFVAWFCISQLTLSRSIFLIILLMASYLAFIRFSGLGRLVFVISLISLVLVAGNTLIIPSRFTTGYQFDSDISTLQRYGTLYLIVKEYLLSYTWPVIPLAADISICSKPPTILDGQICKLYAPALGFTGFYITTLPMFLFVVLSLHRRIIYMSLPIFLAGMTYWVTVTPAIVSLVLIWLGRREFGK